MKKEKNYEPIAKAKYSKMKKMIASIERDYGGNPEIIDNMEIPFEYIIGSLFPQVMDNINKECARQYIKGFYDRLDIKKVSNIEKIDNELNFKFILEDINKINGYLSVLLRKEDITDNDKEVLKQIKEILEKLYNNTKKFLEE